QARQNRSPPAFEHAHATRHLLGFDMLTRQLGMCRVLLYGVDDGSTPGCIRQPQSTVAQATTHFENLLGMGRGSEHSEQRRVGGGIDVAAVLVTMRYRGVENMPKPIRCLGLFFNPIPDRLGRSRFVRWKRHGESPYLQI